jgi:hypothetical protein
MEVYQASSPSVIVNLVPFSPVFVLFALGLENSVLGYLYKLALIDATVLH